MSRKWIQRRPLWWSVIGILTLLLGSCAGLANTAPEQRSHAPDTILPDGWATYMAENERTGFNKHEAVINPTTAPDLKLQWAVNANARIFSQPVVVNGIIYWGSGDGLEHATDLNGKQIWATNIGTSRGICTDDIGILNTSTVASLVIGKKQTLVVFVGGGNGRFYALNAATGAIIWSTLLGSPPDHFLWSSPVVYKGSVYEGMSSLADCPLVQGALVQMNAATGKIIHDFDTVPDGCVGASIWASPTIDTAAGMIYIATGNGGECSKAEPYAVALLKLRVSDLTLQDFWQVPASNQTPDSDFGATPTLFNATIGGVAKQLVGLTNKNGFYYAFDRTSLRRGPVWKARISCWACGDEDPDLIAPSAWDGTTLYVPSRGATIGGTICSGSLRALDPATGDFIWEHCIQDGGVFGAVTLIPGVTVISAGPSSFAISTASGQTLFRHTDPAENFMGPASVVDGVLYIGSYTGTLYAFGL